LIPTHKDVCELLTALHDTEKFFMKVRATPTFSNLHPDQSAAINIEARPSSAKIL
jgi:hypothetical protein